MRLFPWLALLASIGACGRSPPSGQAAPGAITATPVVAAPHASPLVATSSAPSSSPAASAHQARDVLAIVPRALADAPPRPLVSPHAGLHGPVRVEDDGAWVRRLGGAPITSVRWNGGGSSVTLRVRFADGALALMKPAQKRSSSNHRGEIAAYHLDRLVGFGRTAVVVGRRVSRALVDGADADERQRARIASEVIDRDGVVETAMIAWHEGPLVADDGVPARALEAGAPADEAPRVAGFSDLFVFDYLIDNTDRWSGGNVLTRGAGGPLVFLDNASSFLSGRARQHATNRKTIARVCRFVATTVAALRAIAAHTPSLAAALGASLARDPLAPVLDDITRSAVDERVASLLAHVDGCLAAEGAAVLLPDPGARDR